MESQAATQRKHQGGAARGWRPCERWGHQASALHQLGEARLSPSGLGLVHLQTPWEDASDSLPAPYSLWKLEIKARAHILQYSIWIHVYG